MNKSEPAISTTRSINIQKNPKQQNQQQHSLVFWTGHDASESCWGFSSVKRCNLNCTSRSKPEGVLKPSLQCGFLHLQLLLVTVWSLLVSLDTSSLASKVLFFFDVPEWLLAGGAWFLAPTKSSSDKQSTAGSAAASASSSERLVTGGNAHCSSCKESIAWITLEEEVSLFESSLKKKCHFWIKFEEEVPRLNELRRRSVTFESSLK